MRHYRRQLHTFCTQLPQPRLCLRGRIIPAGADAEQFTRPVAGQKDAAINLFGIVDMQLSCESIDVVFDRARPNSDGHANVSIVEPLGQKIENFDFSRRNVNRTRPRCAGMGTPQKFWAGTARWCGAFASSSSPFWSDYRPSVIRLGHQIEQRAVGVARNRLVREQIPAAVGHEYGYKVQLITE